MNALEIRAVVKSFAGQGAVLRDVSLSVAPGERFVLLGASGSGKTTLLRLVAGLDDPDSGEILLGGRSVRAVPAERRDLGVVFQQPLLFPHLSVTQNVAFGLRVRGVPRREARDRAREVLGRVGLEGLEGRLPRELSGGQAQRVALARALVVQPRAVLLDEPFSALDAPLRRELRSWLTELLRREGTTTVLVTHDQEEALAVGDRIGLLHAGHLLQAGPPEVFFVRPASLEVARFFGGVNVVRGIQVGLVVRTSLGSFTASVERHGPVTLHLRPEAFVRAGAPRGAECPNSVTATVESVEFGGAFRKVTVLAGADRLVWHAPPHEVFVRGDEVTLHCPPGLCWTLPEE